MSAARITVAVALLRNPQGEILVSRRRPDQHLPGLLEFPGGKVEAGESTVQALVRELLEELEIKVSESDVGAAPWLTVQHDYSDKQVHLEIREVFRFSGKPRGAEGQELAWLAPEKMQPEDFPAADAPIIEKLIQGLRLTHIDEQGQANMVDIGHKSPAQREARAEARVRMAATTFQLLLEGGHPKGDVFASCRIAGIQAAKKTAELIPLCHTLSLSSVKVEMELLPEESVVRIEARCRVQGQTGVEMEALTAASVAALTLYDMCKARDRGIVIESLQLLEKCGGVSGHWQRA